MNFASPLATLTLVIASSTCAPNSNFANRSVNSQGNQVAEGLTKSKANSGSADGEAAGSSIFPTPTSSTPGSQNGAFQRNGASLDSTAAWLTGTSPVMQDLPPVTLDQRSNNLSSEFSSSATCSETTCGSTSPFAASICRDIWAPITLPLEFVGFVGNGIDWAGPYTDNIGRKYFAHVADTSGGNPDTTFKMKGIRYRVRHKKLKDGDPFHIPMRLDRGWANLVGSIRGASVASGEFSELKHNDYPANPYYEFLPQFDIRNGGYIPVQSPEVPRSMLPDPNIVSWSYVFPGFYYLRVLRYRFLVGTTVAFDSDDVTTNPAESIFNSQGYWPFKELRVSDRTVQDKAVDVPLDAEIALEVWYGLELQASPGGGKSSKSVKVARVYTTDPPTAASKKHMESNRLDQGNLYDYFTGPYLKLSSRFPNSGAPVTPLFTPLSDWYELTFDRLGEFAPPSNPWLLQEKMPSPWALQAVERGKIEAKAGTSGLRMEWFDDNPRIVLGFVSASLKQQVTAFYYPSDNKTFARYLTAQTRTGTFDIDLGPSGTFDWAGETTFEIGAISANPNTSNVIVSYPTWRDFNFAATIPDAYPLKIKAKFIPKKLVAD